MLTDKSGRLSPQPRAASSPMRLTRQTSEIKPSSPTPAMKKASVTSNNLKSVVPSLSTTSRKSIPMPSQFNSSNISERRSSLQRTQPTSLNPTPTSSSSIRSKSSGNSRVSLSPITPSTGASVANNGNNGKTMALVPTVPKLTSSRSRPSLTRPSSKMSEKTSHQTDTSRSTTPTSSTSRPNSRGNAPRNNATTTAVVAEVENPVQQMLSHDSSMDGVGSSSKDSTYICYESYCRTNDSCDSRLLSFSGSCDVVLDSEILQADDYISTKNKRQTYQENPLHGTTTRYSTGSSHIVLNDGNNNNNLELITALSHVENLKKEIFQLKTGIEKKDTQLSQCTMMLKNSFIRQAEVEDRASMLMEEIAMFKFLNSIQEQKISELEQTISSNRMEHNEAMSSKARKHKQMVKKMTAERNEQENRTNSMINQLNEQMSLLQKMAMERMEILEKELMLERHKSAQKIEGLERIIASDKLKYSRLLSENNALKVTIASSNSPRQSRPLREIDLNDPRASSLSRSYSKSNSRSFDGSNSDSGSISRSRDSASTISTVKDNKRGKKSKAVSSSSNNGGRSSRQSLDSSVNSCDSDDSTDTVPNKNKDKSGLDEEEEDDDGEYEMDEEGEEEEEEEAEVDQEEEEEEEEVDEDSPAESDIEEEDDVAALESSEIMDDAENLRVTSSDSCEENNEVASNDVFFIPSSSGKEKEREKAIASVPFSPPLIKNWSI